MNIKRFKFQVTGISPLLMNNPVAITQPKNGKAGDISARKKDYGTPEEQAKLVEYRDAKGNLYAPSIWFRQALLYACVGKKVGKTSANKIVSASVFNCDDKTTLVHPKNNKPITDWIANVTPAVVDNARIARCRPQIDEWSVVVAFDVDTDLISEDAIEKLLNEAGFLSGCGDYRPSKKGPYGRFTAALAK